MRSVQLSIAAVLVLFASYCSAAQGVNVSLAFKDRRVPYYVLPGCDFMLDAGDRCEQSALRVFAPAVGCCPIGFVCITPQEETRLGLSGATYLRADEPNGLKVARCHHVAPAYTMSPGCSKDKQAKLGESCSGKCCPDGLRCVPSSLQDAAIMTCQWTGQPIVPPPGYKVSERQMIPTDTATPRMMPPMDLVPIWLANNGSEVAEDWSKKKPDMRQTCTAGYTCPSTTLPTGCSRTGARWQAPSCKCYDQPLPEMMAGAPPPLDVDSRGRWIRRGTTTLAAVQGINWFGFNNGQTMLDGLWSGYQNATLGDFPTVLKRLKLLGFNGIRMPFTFQDLDRTPGRGMYASDCKVDSIGQFRRSLTPTYTSVSSSPRLNLASIYTSAASCPYDTRPTETAQGRLSTANKHLPGQQDSTTWNRFFWVIQYMVGQGFYVVIDFHFEQPGLQNNQNTFAAEWRRLWTDLVSLPTYKTSLDGRVFPEMANEWDKFGCRWDTATGGCSVTYQASMETASTAIKTSSRGAGVPIPPILVEGTGQLNYGFNWGDGFVTDSTAISNSGISNPRSWFSRDRLSSTGYRTVLAPHVYGPSVTSQAANQVSGTALWNRLQASWGSKSPAAVLDTTIRQQYTVAVTEWGSDCDTYNPTNSPRCISSEAQHLRDLVAYLSNAASLPRQFRSKHRNAMWFWWSWNANSGDTGGLVTGDGTAPWYIVKW